MRQTATTDMRPISAAEARKKLKLEDEQMLVLLEIRKAKQEARKATGTKTVQ